VAGLDRYFNRLRAEGLAEAPLTLPDPWIFEEDPVCVGVISALGARVIEGDGGARAVLALEITSAGGERLGVLAPDHLQTQMFALVGAPQGALSSPEGAKDPRLAAALATAIGKAIAVVYEGKKPSRKRGGWAYHAFQAVPLSGAADLAKIDREIREILGISATSSTTGGRDGL